MHKFIELIKSIFDNTTIVMIIMVALFVLFVDGPKLQKDKLAKEYKIIQIISYSYIAIGVMVFVFLKMV